MVIASIIALPIQRELVSTTRTCPFLVLMPYSAQPSARIGRLHALLPRFSDRTTSLAALTLGFEHSSA